MADCIMTDDGSGANASLLADRSFGAYSIKALLKLKQHVSATCWLSTLRKPTEATVAISHRFFDLTYDQFAWQMSNHLVSLYGLQSHLQPFPILVSNSFLKEHGIPLLRDLDARSKAQLLSFGADPFGKIIRGPDGRELLPGYVMGIVFELLELSYRDRQEVTRFMLVSMASLKGADINFSEFQKLIDKDAIARFASKAMSFGEKPSEAGDGVFSINRL
jgi:hypothetical protein